MLFDGECDKDCGYNNRARGHWTTLNIDEFLKVNVKFGALDVFITNKRYDMLRVTIRAKD